MIQVKHRLFEALNSPQSRIKCKNFPSNFSSFIPFLLITKKNLKKSLNNYKKTARFKN